MHILEGQRTKMDTATKTSKSLGLNKQNNHFLCAAHFFLVPDLFLFFYFFIITIIINIFNFGVVNETKTNFLALSDLEALAKNSNPGRIVRVGCKTRD